MIKINHLTKLGIISTVFLLSTVATFAEEAVLQEAVDSITAMPTVQKIDASDIQEGATGSVRIFTDPVTGNSAGSIPQAAGKKPIQFTRSTNSSNGFMDYVLHNNGVTSTATVNNLGDIVASSGPDAAKAAQVAKDLTSAVAKAETQLTTITSEKIPGAKCECKDTVNQCNKVETRKYECTTGKGLSGFQAVFAQIIRYVINIVLLLAVLAIVGLGIAWSFAGGDDVKMKSTLKTWAINIIV